MDRLEEAAILGLPAEHRRQDVKHSLVGRVSRRSQRHSGHVIYISLFISSDYSD